MRIAKVHIENFRSISRLEFELSQVTALIGANNSGKSNILLALKRVLGGDWVTKSTFTENDVRGHDPSLDIVVEVTLDPPLDHSRFKYGPSVSIGKLRFEWTRYRAGAQAGERRLEQTCLSLEGQPLSVPKSAPKKGEKLQFERLVGIPAEVRQAIPMVHIGTDRSIREQLPSARYSLLRQLLEDVERDFRDTSQKVVVGKDSDAREVLRSERFTEVMSEAMGLLRTDDFVELENMLKTKALEQLGFDPVIDAEMLDLYFAPLDPMDFYKNLDLRVREGDCAVSATELGGGVQNALVMAILQAFERRRKRGAVLLIEEPEMFLHPQMQRSLYKTLRAIGEANQVIYTTHSPHFIQVQDYDEIRLVTKKASGTMVTVSSLQKTSERSEKLRKELDPERSELFFAARVLLVEGDTEKLALPEYGKRLSVDLDRAGATIVEVGGKRNLMEFALIARSLQIPVGIVYDSDSKSISDEDNKSLNEQLADLADANTRTWRLEPDYESELRVAFGDDEYLKACGRYPGRSKPVKARLIAAEPDSPIPPKVDEMLRWLGNAGKPQS